MAKRKTSKPPVPVPPPVSDTRAQPTVPAEGNYHTITSLATLCGVTEQTVRRWLWYETIPAPRRYGRLLWWPKDEAEEIARRYLTDGKFVAVIEKVLTGNKP